MLPPIDWAQPWYDTVRPAFARAAPPPGGFIDAFNTAADALDLRNGAGQPLRFVPQSSLPDGTAYEEFIGATGQVPTRENLHDFFNALVWQTFPLIKRALNTLQAAQIAQAGVGKSRGPARDAATIFDENAALLVVRETPAGRALVDDLRAHRWLDALYDKRAMFGRDAEVWLFGHALMEKLVTPRKAITAHTRVVFVGDDYFALTPDARRAWIDRDVATEVAAEGIAPSGFTPLQVLGVPGWWPGQDPDFYGDTTVFRPRRTD